MGEAAILEYRRMRRRLPLNALRAFEAAARHQSLSRAADELCVTPTAISHHIRLLEDFIQSRLFVRSHGNLELTQVARDSVGRLSEAIDLIDTVLSEMLKPQRKARVIVTASPSVVSLWLLPRLHRFCDLEPDTDVELNISSEALVLGASTDVWIASRRTSLDMRVQPLMGETIIPVCSPKLLATCTDAKSALRRLALIHDEKVNSRSHGPFPTWERYLSEVGVKRADMRRGLRFSQSNLAIDAAVEGHGMVLGRSPLIASGLMEGRLVQLGDPYTIQFQYFVVSPWQASSPAASRFRDWLLDEATHQPA